MKLILASRSPRRSQLLRTLGIPFKVVPSGVDETSAIKNPERLVKELAIRKAKSIAEKYKNDLVLGADTLVFWKGKVFGQPKDSNHAYKMLYRLGGTTHFVYTGVAVVEGATGKVTAEVSRSRVYVKKLPLDKLLELARKNHDKAGAYGIQEKKDPIARIVSGSYNNVVGLPTDVVKRLLRPYRAVLRRAIRVKPLT